MKGLRHKDKKIEEYISFVIKTDTQANRSLFHVNIFTYTVRINIFTHSLPGRNLIMYLHTDPYTAS